MHDAGPPTHRSDTERLQFLVRLLRWRAFILINTGLVAVLAVVISLLLPNWYAAQVSILPPQEESLGLGGLGSGLSSILGTGGTALSLVGGVKLPLWASPSDYLAGILRSRRLREEVIREHDLENVYRCDNIDQALKIFGGRIRIRVGTEGIVRVRLLDKEPERAAAMAASCLRVLDEVQRETGRSRASDVRRFIEERLDATRHDLAAAEDSLQVFQERYGLLVPEEQAAALVRTAASVEAERLAALVKRDVLSAQAGADHPEVQRLNALGHALEQAKASLEGRMAASSPEAREGPQAIIALDRLPSLSLRYLRLYREVEIQGALFELLTQLLEQYRIQEVRDVATIQVLDPPVVPHEKAKPHRAVICVVATLLAFLASLAVAALLERAAMLAERDPERHALLVRLLSGLGLRFLIRGR